MKQKITKIDSGSPLFGKAGEGDLLVSINGEPILDVMDYKFHSYDSRLRVELRKPDGKIRRLRIEKGEGEDLGLSFESYLMDKARHCANDCVFCFIDQLPGGMRETLYFKDDDARLSFLTGNYITLTNLSSREIERIIALRISPINISVHTTNPALREKMLRNPRAGECMDIMKRLAGGGITMNCQIVCCPGLNDGDELRRSMEDLAGLYPAVSSVSVVPVGLSRHREGLYPLEPFTGELAAGTLEIIDSFAGEHEEKTGCRLFYAGDEFFLLAGREIPPERYYEGFPQLENGVGMLRLFEDEFLDELERGHKPRESAFTVITGTAASGFVEKLLMTARRKYDNIVGSVLPIENEFFGSGVTVSGLLTGGDIIRQIKGRDLGKRLLIPLNMLRRGEDVFLDDVTVGDLEKAAGVPAECIPQDGGAFLRSVLGIVEV